MGKEEEEEEDVFDNNGAEEERTNAGVRGRAEDVARVERVANAVASAGALRRKLLDRAIITTKRCVWVLWEQWCETAVQTSMKYRLSTDLCESLIQSDWFLGLSGSVSLSLLCCCCVRNETSVGTGEHFGSEVGGDLLFMANSHTAKGRSANGSRLAGRQLAL